MPLLERHGSQVRSLALQAAHAAWEETEKALDQTIEDTAAAALEDNFLRLLESFRIYAEEIGARTYRLNPDAMHSTEFPSLEQGVTAVTFDRETALVARISSWRAATTPCSATPWSCCSLPNAATRALRSRQSTPARSRA